MTVCRNINTNDAYLHLSENRWRNLRTGVEGEIAPELAQKSLLINVELTMMLAENKEVETLINALNLKIEKL